MESDKANFGNWYTPHPKIYQQRFPSQAFLLYRGFAELIYGDNETVIEGQGRVTLEWHPTPSIELQFSCQSDNGFDLGPAELKLTELGLDNRAKVYLRRSEGHSSGKRILKGRFEEAFFTNTLCQISSLVFNITNFEFFNIDNLHPFDDKTGDWKQPLEGWLYFQGQMVFQDKEWRIVLCTLDSCFDLEEKLQSQGGYGITHICKLERIDKKPFEFEASLDIVEAFTYYLSFARGIWISPIMFAGYNDQGKLIFERWGNVEQKSDPWSDRSCWFQQDSEEIVRLFSGFIKLWGDESWNEAIKSGIEWFIESYKCSSGISASIILQVAALERLGWALLVSSRNALSADGFGKLTAADKIKLLISYLNIKLDFEESFPILLQKAKGDNHDLLEVVIEIRNKIVHPPKKRRNKKSDDFDDHKLNEAWKLGNYLLLSCLFELIEMNIGS